MKACIEREGVHHVVTLAWMPDLRRWDLVSIEPQPPSTADVLALYDDCVKLCEEVIAEMRRL